MKRFFIIAVVSFLFIALLAYPELSRAQNYSSGPTYQQLVANVLEIIQKQLLVIQEQVQKLVQEKRTLPSVTPSVLPVAPTMPTESNDFSQTGNFIVLDELPNSPTVSCVLPPLQFGSQEKSVYLLQLILRQAGYYPEGLITGFYGRLTQKAVQNFQKAKGLTVNGIVDRATVQALNSEISKYYSECKGGDFSSDTRPYIIVTAPAGDKGGQDIPAGSTYTIRWNASSNVKRVKIYLCTQSDVCQLLGGIPDSGIVSTGYFNWYVDPNHPYFPANDLRIKVVDATSGVFGYSGYFDVASGNFVTDIKPYIRVTAPAGDKGGQDIPAGSTYTIRWNASSNVKRVKIYLCTQSDVCQLLGGIPDSGIVSTGYFNWYVDPNHPYFPANDLRIKVVDATSGVFGYSGYFDVAR